MTFKLFELYFLNFFAFTQKHRVFMRCFCCASFLSTHFGLWCQKRCRCTTVMLQQFSRFPTFTVQKSRKFRIMYKFGIQKGSILVRYFSGVCRYWVHFSKFSLYHCMSLLYNGVHKVVLSVSRIFIDFQYNRSMS